MAEAFEFSGPTDVGLDVQPTGSPAALGRTDGEERISFDLRIFGREVSADEDGLVPAEVIHLGSMGLLTMQLVKWDRVQLEALWNTIPRSAVTSDSHLHAGDVGRLWSTTGVAAIGFFGIILTPDLTDTRVIRTFNKCYLLGDDAIREAEIGNDKTVLRLSIHVLPDSNGDLYAKTTTS